MGKTYKISIISLFILGTVFTSCSGTRPNNLGPHITSSTGKKIKTLQPCPETPNCVTSYIHNSDEAHYLEKLNYEGSRDEVINKLTSYVNSKGYLKIIKSSDVYLYIEWTSPLMKFVDDLELLFNEKGVIHFRSASRIGRKDFGSNKKHIEELKGIL